MALDQAPRDEWAGLLQSLLIAETNFRRSRGESPIAREYLPRFPAHAEVVREVVPDTHQAPMIVPTVLVAEEVIPEPPPLPIRQMRYPESPAVLVAPLPSAPVARLAAPLPMVVPNLFEDLEPEVEFTPPIPGRPRRRRRWLIGFVVLLLLGGAATAIYFVFLRPKGGEQPPPPNTPGGPTQQPKGSGYNPLATPKNANADPERELAEWVLFLGGRGTVLPEGSSRRPFSTDAPLPKNKFNVIAFSLPPEAAGRWTAADLERLRGRTMLGSIQLHAGGPFTEEMLAPLVGLPLRTVELIGGPVQASGAFFAAFPELETLTLPSTPGWTDADLTAVSKLTKLVSLSVNSAKITPNGFKELKSPTIKSLIFGDKLALTAEHVRVFSGLEQLEEFEARGGMTDEVFLEFSVFQQLKRIRLYKTTLTDAGLKALEGIGKLEELRIDGSAITGEGLKLLADRPKLKIVDFGGAKLTNSNVGLLLALPALKELRLAGNPIGDQSAVLLAQIEGAEVLDLSATDISDVTLRTIQKIPNLKTLIVTNTKVTDSAARGFEMAVPGCKVVSGRRK
jgi:hypothetical protein